MYSQHILGPYTRKEHYACFHCRKMFRQPAQHQLSAPIPAGEKRVAPCPQCKVPMNDLGKHFKPPRQTDIKQWKKVEMLYAAGCYFGGYGSLGPMRPPKTLKEAKSFLIQRERSNAQVARLNKIRQKALELSQKRDMRARMLRGKKLEAKYDAFMKSLKVTQQEP